VTTTKIFGIILKIGSQVEVDFVEETRECKKKTIGSTQGPINSPHILYLPQIVAAVTGK